ncbi:MAG: cbb3-type cytochrome oxidase assembly protein CcoS [Candidatus Sericytochromatia bacterium]|nr:cbb3-type cytochrome oxidase assembly protein CcoS [Candidatus Sericytochromatia bacterium]
MNMGLYLFGLAFCMGSSAWCFLAWAVKDGQFKEDEEIQNLALASEDKYR